MDVNQAYYGEHFIIYANIKSYGCKPETHMLYKGCPEK